MKKHLLPLLLLLTLSNTVKAQVSPSSDLYKTILSKDSLLFNIGFNTCDISQFETLYSEDFEFFHDKDSISNKKDFLHKIQNGLCGSTGKYQSRRELLESTSEVFPLFKKEKIYGAIQTGVHNFYETIENQNENFASSARFTHVWTIIDGQWKLKRSLSYDHQTELAKPYINIDNHEELEAWLKEIGIPALGLGIIDQGELQEIKVIGQLNSARKAPYNTIFNVASLTKPITAMVALKLASLNKWDLDEPLYKYWTDPDLKNDDRTKLITTRLIISHQTGFPNWRNQKLTFDFTPGTRYQYSGEGFEYLRNALEKKFKKSLNQLATELIFEPIGMNDTQYIWTEDIDSSRVVLGFNKEGKSYEFYKRKIGNGADDLLTTIEDYANFLISTINGDGLSDKILEEMKSPQVASNNGKHFGLGFERYDFKDGNFAISHGGSDRGVQAITFIFPETKQGLLIFTNADHGYMVYEKLLSHYLGQYGKEIFEIEMGKK